MLKLDTTYLKIIDREYFVDLDEIPRTQISSDGRIRTYIVWKGKRHYREPTSFFERSPKGYSLIYFQGKNHFLHLIIAEAFIPNPENKPFINHYDGIKIHNWVGNLERVTAKENSQHSMYILRRDTDRPKRAVKIFKDGVLIAVSVSVTEAANYCKGAVSNVSAVCKGNRKQHNGYTFEYTDLVLPGLIKILEANEYEDYMKYLHRPY